jgi:dTDP-4-amino-4,6-dideoxygalactose transaminase
MIWRCDLLAQYQAYQAEVDAAISRVLRSGRYVLAQEGEAFAREFAAYLGTRHAAGVANGTDALILAMQALAIGPGDEVITTPFTAIPTVSAIIDRGARPVFVDVSPDTFLLDLDQVIAARSPRTKAILPVHIFGNVVDIPRLRSLVGPELPIIEDACQAHGSTLDGVKAGAFGDLAAFSFYPTKNLGGYGDGGLVASQRAELIERIVLLRMYGMTDYNHIVINGRNSRLDELQAAVLRAKLPYLSAMNQRRRQIAARYARELPSARFVPQRIPDNVESNYHVYACRFLGDRARFMAYCDQHELQTNIYYLMPLHLQQANAFLGLERGALPVVEKLCDQVIALPMYPELPEATLDRIVAIIGAYRE